MDVEHAEAEADYGTFAPSRSLQAVLQVTRRMPGFWLGRQFAHVLRHLVLPQIESPVDVEVYACHTRLHLGDNVCEKRLLFTPQYFDPEERRFLQRRLRPGFTFVDLGANMGAYSLYVAHEAGPDSRIIAVEADPVMFQRLQFNVAANGMTNVSAVQAAINDAAGEAELFVNTRNRGQNSLVVETSEALRVPSLTLLELFDAQEVERPDCVKLDIEFAEYRVLSRFLDEAPADRRPDGVILEHTRRTSLSDAGCLLLDHGYRIVCQTPMNLVLERCT